MDLVIFDLFIVVFNEFRTILDDVIVDDDFFVIAVDVDVVVVVVVGDGDDVYRDWILRLLTTNGGFVVIIFFLFKLLLSTIFECIDFVFAGIPFDNDNDDDDGEDRCFVTILFVVFVLAVVDDDDDNAIVSLLFSLIFQYSKIQSRKNETKTAAIVVGMNVVESNFLSLSLSPAKKRQEKNWWR